jgi:hypothetical protein
MASQKKYRNVENKPLADAMRDLRRSSAASPHADSRTARARTRSAAKRRAMREGY